MREIICTIGPVSEELVGEIDCSFIRLNGAFCSIDFARKIIVQAKKFGKRVLVDFPNAEGRKRIGKQVIDFDVKKWTGFINEIGVDYVGYSYTGTVNEIDFFRATFNKGQKIVAKIETGTGLENFVEIISACDIVMIDREDLCTSVGLENVTLAQKKILKECVRQGKPCIVATELLESMVSNSFPLQAEISDVTNAVLDGASYFMLSEETAIGKFPFECIAVLRKILEAFK